MQQPTHVQRNRQPQPPPMASPTAAPIPPWPEVRYQGMVRGVKNGKTTALVRIAGKEHLVSKGDRPSDLLVVLFNSDSLVLERDRKERRTFKAK